jgi:hypothetical protein
MSAAAAKKSQNAVKGLLSVTAIDPNAIANYDNSSDTGSVIAFNGPNGHVPVAVKWSTFLLVAHQGA